MTDSITQADYNQLETIAGKFGQLADSNAALHSRLAHTSRQLKGGGWAGAGAVACLNEMEGEIFPALQRLTQALEQAQTTTRQSSEIICAAEEEAAGLFRGGDTPDSIGGWVDMGGKAGNSILISSLFSTLFGEKGATIGKGLLSIPGILKDSGVKLPKRLERLFDALGIVIDIFNNPDSEHFQSGLTSLMEVGAGIAYPPLGLAMGVSDLIQMLNEGSRWMDSFAIDILGTDSPEMRANLQHLSDRFHQNVERLDLDNIINPIADAIYEYSVTPYVDAFGEAWNNPTPANILRLGEITIRPAPVRFLLSDEARAGVWGEVEELGQGLLDFGRGALDLNASFKDVRTAFGTAAISKVTDYLPIPDNWESRIDNSSKAIVDRIDKGLIPGINVPGLPFV